MAIKKKLLALGLSVAMVAGLTACGGSTSTTSTDASADTTKEADAAQDTTEDVEEESADTTTAKSGEKRKITIGTWYDHYYDSTNEDIHDDPSVSDEECRDRVCKPDMDRYPGVHQYLHPCRTA